MLHFFSTLQPRTIIVITLMIAALMFTSAIIELRQVRSDLLHVLQEHSLSLSETIINSSANIVLSSDHLESEITERLMNNAHFIARLDSLGMLTNRDLESIARQNNLFRINIFSRSGVRVLSNASGELHTGKPKRQQSPNVILKPILSGKTDRMVIGLKEARFEEGERYAVAVRRTRSGGGAIVVNLDAAQLIEFRKEIGVGKLIQDLGNHEGIEYVVLQDEEGILAASGEVTEISSIEDDSLLQVAARIDTTVVRQTWFQSREVFEVVKQLIIDKSSVGLLRIGLSMDEIRMTDERMERRFIVMIAALVMLSIIIIAFIAIGKNYKIVSLQYGAMQMLTASIFEQMNDAVITIDSKDTITIFNHQAEMLFGDMAASAVRGKRIDELPAELAQCLRHIFSQSGEHFEHVITCRPDDRRNVMVSITMTKGEQGEELHRTAVITDMTEMKRLQKEMQRSEKLSAMGALASGVAHEIRNPLNAISMIAQRFEKEFTPRTSVKEYRSLTSVLKKESMRVNGIVQQFLKFARPKKIQLKKVSAKEFAEHVTGLLEAQAKEKHIHPVSRCTVEETLSIDAEQMTQALLNIIQNALEATPSGGTVSFSMSKKLSDIVFDVTDTGIGIPQDKVEKIFNLYYSTKPTGSGLGLSITQQIVSQHQGTVTVSSVELKGTTVTITIPQTI